MKNDVHPEYHPEAKVKCDCGNEFTVGSTKSEIEIEVCHKCHPFYTGEKKVVDATGRVERFEQRRKKSEKAQKEQSKSESEQEKQEKEEDKEETESES